MADTDTPYAHDTADGEPRRWTMWAGLEHGQWAHFGHRRYTEAFGVTPQRVDIIECAEEDATHWGWIRTDDDGTEQIPSMIQPRFVLYTIQFTYGPVAEEDAGKGYTVRLRVEPRGAE